MTEKEQRERAPRDRKKEHRERGDSRTPTIILS